MEISSESSHEVKSISIRKIFDKKTILLLGFAAITLFIYFLLEDISISSMFELIKSTNFIILIIGGIFTFIAVLTDTLAWKILLGISDINPSTCSIFRIQLSSFSYGLLIPSAGAVEIIMRVTLGIKEFSNEKEDRKATSGEILSSVVAHKLCGLLAFIPISIFLVIAMFSYFSKILINMGYPPLPNNLGGVFVLFISFISLSIVSIFIFIAKSPESVKKISFKLLNFISLLPIIGRFSRNIIEPLENIIDDFSIQFAYLAKNKFFSFIALILAFLSQFAHWISIFFILHSIQIPISLDQVAAVNFLGGTVDFIPLGIPGMAGLKEISLSVFLKEGLNLDSYKAFSGSILVQLVKFYFLIIIGIIVYVIGKTKISVEDLDKKIVD